MLYTKGSNRTQREHELGWGKKNLFPSFQQKFSISFNYERMQKKKKKVEGTAFITMSPKKKKKRKITDTFRTHPSECRYLKILLMPFPAQNYNSYEICC